MSVISAGGRSGEDRGGFQSGDLKVFQRDRSFIWFCHCASSLDHHICSSQHVRRNRQTDLLGCIEIDDELELGRLFDWKVSGIGTF